MPCYTGRVWSRRTHTPHGPRARHTCCQARSHGRECVCGCLGALRTRCGGGVVKHDEVPCFLERLACACTPAPAPHPAPHEDGRGDPKKQQKEGEAAYAPQISEWEDASRARSLNFAYYPLPHRVSRRRRCLAAHGKQHGAVGSGGVVLLEGQPSGQQSCDRGGRGARVHAGAGV